tara:strand:+ start:7597 stop:9027 length:1431 start_codon:yes stop_codon:yes gene_type:complete
MVPQISLGDYDGLNGFGTSTTGDVNELSKALSAGYQVSNQTGGSALRVESLEASLKVVTWSNKHIKLWKKIPKSPAYSTVEEYNVLSQYGAAGAFGFTREGELPGTQDSTYTRMTALVKFIGTTRSVTHPATLVNPAHGDVIALENQNGILWMLERVEDSLFHGNSGLAFDGEAEQWDGLDALINNANVIDLEGQPLQEADIEEASNLVIENYGYPTDMFLGTRAMSDLVKTFYPRERVNMPAPSEGKVGLSVTSMATQAGTIEFNPDVFIRQGKQPPAAATSANAPATPAAIVNGGAAGTASWAKSLGAAAGGFSYAVTACNRFGESAPVLSATYNVGAGSTTANGIQVTNAAAIGANPPEFFIIYRTRNIGSGGAAPADLSQYSEIARVRCTNQGAGVMGVQAQDLNATMPFTETAYLGELTPSVLTFRQLAPLMRMDLAVLAPAYRWMIMLYGTPILFAPRKWVRLTNIGRLS